MKRFCIYFLLLAFLLGIYCFTQTGTPLFTFHFPSQPDISSSQPPETIIHTSREPETSVNVPQVSEEPLQKVVSSGEPCPRWIDRVILPDYACEFYNQLVEASDNDGNQDWLIDVTLGEYVSHRMYAIPITELSGEAQNMEEAKKQANEKSAIVYQNIQAAYDAFTMDYPGVFWLAGGTHCATNISFNGSTYQVQIYFVLQDPEAGSDIRAVEYQDPDLIREHIAVRDQAVSEIVTAVGGSPAQIARGLNRWLTAHNGYNTLPTDAIPDAASRAICALTGNHGDSGPICEAYARAFKILCDNMGIPCVLTRGIATSGDGSQGLHAWNYVQLNGSWYAMDVTWNDAAINGQDTHGQTDYELVGADTVIHGMPFEASHQEQNQISSNGWIFSNGPVLSPSAYAE